MGLLRHYLGVIKNLLTYQTENNSSLKDSCWSSSAFQLLKKMVLHIMKIKQYIFLKPDFIVLLMLAKSPLNMKLKSFLTSFSMICITNTAQSTSSLSLRIKNWPLIPKVIGFKSYSIH